MTLGEADTVLTGAGDIIGTVGYMAPEQVRGQPADARSDLFALGVVCYEMLAGRRPFVGESAPEIAAAILCDDSPALPANVPPGLARVVRRCLEKDPARRYQSARDLAFALEVPRSEPRRTRIVWPVALGALAVAAITTFFLTRSPRRTETDRSIAVLPFASLSPAPDDAWFADGIHADLLTQLSKIGDLTVISRTSVLQYRQGARNIREIAESLGVAAIVEGSVQRSGNHVRIEVHLVDAHSDKEIWAERYDRELTDVLAIQSAVAEDIASALHAKLSVDEHTHIERKPTESPEAYDLYLRGLEYDLRPDKRPEILQTAERFYREAIELDPSFALAHARLGTLDAVVYWFAVDASVARLTDARTEADRALALQPDLPEAHRAAGYVHYVQRDYDAAMQQFQLDLASAPSDADALMNVGYVQRRMGRFDEAAATMRRALRLDPHSADAMLELCSTLIWLRDWPAADEVSAKLLSWAPDHTGAKVNGALIALASKGDAAPAKDIIARYPSAFDPSGKVIRGDSIIFLLKAFPVDAAVAVSPLPYELIATRYEYYPKGLL